MTAINIFHHTHTLHTAVFVWNLPNSRVRKVLPPHLHTPASSLLSTPFFLWNNFHLMISDFIQSINTGQNYISLLGIQQNLTW